jgi:hypothetical protein
LKIIKTVISDQTNTDYSEWFLGHNKSPYYTKKEPERRESYATKCMKYLTFLDYTTLESTGKNIEAKLSEKEKEIQLRQSCPTQIQADNQQPTNCQCSCHSGDSDVTKSRSEVLYDEQARAQR